MSVKDSVDAGTSVLDGDTTSAALELPGSTLIPKPGLLSTIWSPGYINIVVFSIISLSLPPKYENLADSRRALWIVLNGWVKEFPWLDILSVASTSFGLT